MDFVFFDDLSLREQLKPFTYTRPSAHIRVGILTIAEKWDLYLQNKRVHPAFYYHLPAYLQQKFPDASENPGILINGAACPTEELVNKILDLAPGEGLIYDGNLVAAHYSRGKLPSLGEIGSSHIFHNTEFKNGITLLRYSWDIFVNNAREITNDFRIITQNRNSLPLNDDYTQVYHPENLFLEEGVDIKAAIINAGEGPVYLGKNSKVQEGAMIRGPFALGEEGQVSMGAKIRGGSTIGPFSKGGGEINNSVIFAYSNKAHDGFLGNSVIGEWCNIGADTNTSNLKNNYTNVKVWDFATRTYQDSGRQFVGLLMGDHSKCGIDTMFNTGTVTGVSVNIFNAGFPPKFIPSFSWGGAKGLSVFQYSRAIDIARNVMGRRNVELEEPDLHILKYIFDNRDTI